MTYRPLDVSIQGVGFIPVQNPAGEVLYTRRGRLHVDADGVLQLSSGHHVIPQITVPNQTSNISITPNGEVRVTLSGAAEEVILGQIQVVNFQNPQGLLALGDGVYRATPATGAPIQSVPGENGTGTLLQGSLEASNVNVANRMVDMITTQRAYEMGAKVMSVADQMLGATSGIKG